MTTPTHLTAEARERLEFYGTRFGTTSLYGITLEQEQAVELAALIAGSLSSYDQLKASERDGRSYYEHCGETWRAEGLQQVSECAVCGDQQVPLLFYLPEGASDETAKGLLKSAALKASERDAREALHTMMAQLHAVKNVEQLPFLKGAMGAALQAYDAYFTKHPETP